MMRKRNKTILWIIVVLAILVLVFGCNKAKNQESEQPQTTTASTQPANSEYKFRSYDRLKEHYQKHGRYMGFDSAEEYLAGANAVISNPDALTKTEKEDGDYLYYVEDTNEFVVLSTDGYIRTYFCPDSGKRYFDKQ